MLPVLDNDRTKPPPKIDNKKQTQLESYFILLPKKSIEKRQVSFKPNKYYQTTIKYFWKTEAEQIAFDWDLYNDRRRRWRCKM